MSPERWNRVRELVSDARKLPPGERADLLKAWCEDPEILARAESLLAGVEGGLEPLSSPEAAAQVSRPSQARLIPGSILDLKYRIGRQLGHGAMGAVFQATHLGTTRTVAVKVIMPKLAEHSEFTERFKREAEAA